MQRVPVRIELDARQLSEHPLRVGLSMEASVDTADTNGEPVLAAVKRPTNRTAVFDAAGEAAERRVHEIIARNLGRPA